MGLNLKGLVVLSFLATVGIALLVLGCSLSDYNWWPIFVVIFYVLAPLPIIISRKCVPDMVMSDPYNNRCFELSTFLTAVIVISAYGLPAMMAHTPLSAPLIKWSSAAFIFSGNTLIFTTIYVLVRLIMAEENYGGW